MNTSKENNHSVKPKKIAAYDRLDPSENVIYGAPNIQLENGEYCVPQHFLTYQHTRQSVEALVLNIDYDPHFPVFVSEDENGLYIQIGIVGFDNYQQRTAQAKKKIVYGRKWRVEQQLPTSEIIQTVFLAIKTAREHEIRELFQLQVSNYWTTPFNNHHDLPLMAHNAELVEFQLGEKEPLFTADEVSKCLAKIRYDHAQFQLVTMTEVDESCFAVKLQICTTGWSQLAELNTQSCLRFILEEPSINAFLYAMMDACLKLSDQHVRENFMYKGYQRFSQKNDIEKVSQLSLATRKIDHHNDFFERLAESNYLTDKTRVPKLAKSLLSEKIKRSFSHFGQLDGILPIDN